MKEHRVTQKKQVFDSHSIDLTQSEIMVPTYENEPKTTKGDTQKTGNSQSFS
jgi:hypothetical protein